MEESSNIENEKLLLIKGKRPVMKDLKIRPPLTN